jgi:hypothetical protein
MESGRARHYSTAALLHCTTAISSELLSLVIVIRIKPLIDTIQFVANQALERRQLDETTRRGSSPSAISITI